MQPLSPEGYEGAAGIGRPGPLNRFIAADGGWLRVHARGYEPQVERLLAELHPHERVGGTIGELDEQLAAAIGSMSRDDAAHRLAVAGVPATAVRSYREMSEDPWFLDRDIYQQRVTEDGTTASRVGRLARFSRTPRQGRARKPELGEHSVEVLAEAGVESSTIEHLLAEGAVLT
jgi:crotonobetainyl-CoA:carnitine CoA-transferase CaiB-like acyl-CoA transferase